MIPADTPKGDPVKQKAIEIAITLAVIFTIIIWCVNILSPFLSVTIWGGIIAVAIYTPFKALRDKLGGRKKLALTIIVLLGFAVVIAPLWGFGSSILDSVSGLKEQAEAGALVVPQPADSVKEWPMIGARVHATWSDAASNMSAFLHEHSEQVKHYSRIVLDKVTGLGLGALQFMISILIAAGFLAGAESATGFMRRLYWRLAGERADGLLTLTVATVRSVAVGVLGIAAIQALLGGVGMAVVGVPAAGLLALLVLIVAVAQLPPWLILLPVSIYVFSVETTTVAVVFFVWSMLVSFADMALKPMFLGRGVDAPMPVILLGAIGGMIAAGIVGLFAGAVILALGYKLFEQWLALGGEPPALETAGESSAG